MRRIRDLFLTASVAERFMMEIGYKLIGDEVCLDDLYEHRDTELRGLGLEAPAKRCMKRPASSQTTMDATGDHKNPKKIRAARQRAMTRKATRWTRPTEDKASTSHEKNAVERSLEESSRLQRARTRRGQRRE